MRYHFLLRASLPSHICYWLRLASKSIKTHRLPHMWILSSATVAAGKPSNIPVTDLGPKDHCTSVFRWVNATKTSMLSPFPAHTDVLWAQYPTLSSAVCTWPRSARSPNTSPAATLASRSDFSHRQFCCALHNVTICTRVTRTLFCTSRSPSMRANPAGPFSTSPDVTPSHPMPTCKLPHVIRF